ncbi:MAG: helix-turn-helix domain-containing protein [Caldilineaceae bacterium]
MPTTPISFGVLLRTLRKRAGMTQGDLAAAVGYSISSISALEKEQRLPDVAFVVQNLVPALAVSDAPQLATRLVELAATARGERPPTTVTMQRIAQVVIQEEVLAPPGSLPTLPIALIGRTAQVNQLGDRLRGHGGRLLTLVGPPGIGKTTLALAVAEQVQPHYRDGAVFVALAAIAEPILMASTIATAVGCSDTSPKPPQTRLIEFLRRKIMLLVLDNLEQLTGAGALIAELVAACPGVCVLATSRERLHLRAEQRFKVPPLDLAPAVELFAQRAQAVDADFRLTPHNQPTLEAICERLDCLPLALELCAAQIDLFAPAQLLSQLQARPLELLVDGAHDLPPQHRTLRAAIQRSYALLNIEEQRLFRALGVFVGGFALPEVTTVMTERLETGDQRLADSALPQSLVSALHSLIGKSLVRTETTSNGEQRYLLLETIREFALEQARAHGEEATLRKRHFAAYLQFMRSNEHKMREAEAIAWFTRVESEQDNFRAALQWVLDEKHYADMAWLVVALHWFWGWRGHSYEGLGWLTQLLPHRQVLETNLRLATFVSFYSIARAIEDFQPLRHYWREFLALLEANTDNLLGSAGWLFIAVYASDVAPTVAAYERSIALARTAHGTPGLGPEFCLFTDRDFILPSVLWNYAVFLLAIGEVARAAPLATESLLLHRQRSNRFEIAEGLGTVGLLTWLQNDLTQAQRYLQEAVSIATTFSTYLTLGNWQPLLGLVTFYRGDAVEARRLLTESLRTCLALKDKRLLARVCTYLAEIALWERLLDQAANWLTQSLDYYIDPDRVSIYEVGRLFVAARLATAQQDYQRAATLFGLAEQAHSQIHYALAGQVRTSVDAALAIVRAALDPAVFAAAFTAGQQMTLTEAFTTILTPTNVLA